MNTLIFILATLAVALVLALVALEDPGYVLIARAPYEIEISLALALLLLVAAFAGLYLGTRFVMRSLGARRDLAAWKQRHDRERAGRDILAGYARLIEGDFADAERELTLRVSHSETPLLNYLGAAYAAQQQGDYVRRDAWLDAAASGGRRFRDAIALTRARLQFQAGQLAEARHTIEAMREPLRRRAVSQRMEAEVLRSLGDFEALEKRLGYYRRHGAFAPGEIAELEQQVYSRPFLPGASAPDSANALTRAWSSLPEAERHDAELATGYVSRLIESGNERRARDFILSEMHHHWNPELVPLFTSLPGEREETIRQLRVWLEKHPDDARLLYELAHLTRAAGDDEAAQEYYSRAIRNGAGAKAYPELGELLERAGESVEALRCYRRGLEVRAARNRERSALAASGAQSSTANSKES
ncbi:MAG: hypothetical protein M5U09_24640 [Gammaproteobacteria bacterium]|nr:hypothetical protein [Gammaproteobacteria bacterium]